MDYFQLVYHAAQNCTAIQLLTSLFVVGATYLAFKLRSRHVNLRREQPVTFHVPFPDELKTQWEGKSWDDLSEDTKEILKGQGKGVFSEHKILSYCPADGRLLGDGSGIQPATIGEIDLKCQRAVNASLAWTRTSFSERRKVLRTLLKYILEHQDEIATACCLDTGKTKVDACLGEIMVTVEKLKWTIEHGEKSLQSDRRPTNLLLMYKKNTVRYEPLGTVVACVSWNYPFHNFISPVISAIFAGNAIIVKSSEHTAWSSLFFYDIIQRAISSCGYHRFLVQHVTCLPQHADFLTSHCQVDHVIFIGSRPVALEVCKSTAKSLTSTTVELGGKDPAIILDDSTTKKDLPSIASILMRAVFQSAGQNCVGIERVIALPKVYDELIKVVTPRIQSLRLGSALLDEREGAVPDVGAQLSPKSFDRLEALIAEAVKEGAKLVCGGKRYIHPKYPRGHYFSPTLLVDVTKNMQIAQTELFAPVFVMMRAETTFEAYSLANSAPYALGASVFGHKREDVEACVSGVNAGMVAVNDFATYYAVGLPFGGRKDSGYGRFGGAEGLRNLSNLKAVCEDRWPLIRTQIPRTLDYPIQKSQDKGKNSQNAWEMCTGVVETGYQPSLSGKIDGIKKILNNI